MSRRNVRFEQIEDPALDISSLIDCSFLLLIYFIATSTLSPPETDLGLNIPADAQQTETKVKIDPLIIKIDPEGRIFKNKEIIEEDPSKRSLPTLLEELQRYKEGASMADSEPIVVINASDEVDAQRTVDVINTLSRVEIKNITLTGFRDR